jgi:hypothetical protein
MNHPSVTVEIAATTRRVWEVLADIERWPEWTPTVERIEPLDGGPFAVGSRARIRQPRLPRAVWRVTELVAEQAFTWVTRSPGVCITARHWIEPVASGTRATLSLQFTGMLGPVVAWLTRGLNRRYLALEAQGLSERCTRHVVTSAVVQASGPLSGRSRP